jgi:hypothetical protein
MAHRTPQVIGDGLVDTHHHMTSTWPKYSEVVIGGYISRDT